MEDSILQDMRLDGENGTVKQHEWKGYYYDISCGGDIVSKKGAILHRWTKWNSDGSMTTETGGAVQMSRGMYTGHSTLVYGVQWDAVMRWIYNDASLRGYLTDSSEKGNYSGSVINTGSNSSYQMKNIFDMAGNLWEWTMEACDTAARVGRGGIYDRSGSYGPVSRRINYSPDYSNGYFGFRVALFV